MRNAADGGAIKILLVDDHPIVREGYRRLLERLGGFLVVGEAGEAAAAYDAFRRTEPDAVVMDISMPGASGLEAIRHIRQWDPRARILVSSMHCTAALALKVFRSRRQRLCSKERRHGRIRGGDPRRRARWTRTER
jgi:two-component system, NarL family, invasion response regulator UvrY